MVVYTTCSFYWFNFVLLPFLAEGEATDPSKPVARTYKPATAQAGREATISVAAGNKHEAYNGTRLTFLANVYKMNVTGPSNTYMLAPMRQSHNFGPCTLY